MKVRTRHRQVGLALGIALALGCGGEPSEAPQPEVAAEAIPISGRYEVEGVTVDNKTGSRRDISGTVILAEDGDSYTATFNLNTLFPTQEGDFEAEVIGKGWGTIEGRELAGQTETQIVISTVPGIDPHFAFVPRTTTTRIVSTTTTKIGSNGSVEVVSDSQPAEGEEYSPTRTTLRGSRVAAAGGIGGGQPSAEDSAMGDPDP